MAKTNPTTEIDVALKIKADSLLVSIITERLKQETSLYYNLEQCKSSIAQLRSSFSNIKLTAFTMLEYTERIENLNKSQTLIEQLIALKTKEMMLVKHAEEKKNTL